MVAERFCHYGKPAGHYVPATPGWVFRIHKSGTKRAMCPACQAVRQLPREVIDRMTNEEREARRDTSRSIQQQSQKERKP